MKKFAIAIGVVVLLALGMSFNAWHASQRPLTSTPDAYEVGKTNLHAQLDQTRQYEGQFEKKAWDSIPQLRELITWHQQRIDKLKDNSQATEIVAYDHDSVGRLEKRITDIEARQEAEQQAALERQSEDDGQETGNPSPPDSPIQKSATPTSTVPKTTPLGSAGQKLTAAGAGAQKQTTPGSTASKPAVAKPDTPNVGVPKPLTPKPVVPKPVAPKPTPPTQP